MGKAICVESAEFPRPGEQKGQVLSFSKLLLSTQSVILPISGLGKD